MDEKAVQFVIAIFESEAGAEETLSRLKSEKKEELKGVQAAVAMRKDAESRIHYKDVGMTPAKGAVAGIVIGAIMGIATGGAGLVLGAVGGAVGRRGRQAQARRSCRCRKGQPGGGFDPGRIIGFVNDRRNRSSR